MSAATVGVREDFDQRDWQQHRFGLPPDRWARLKDRSFWVTGAGTGYGQAIATALACAGAQVFLTGRRRKKLEESLDEIRSFGASQERCQVVPADITSDDDVAGACRLIQQECPALQGLVNNAARPQRRTSPWPLQEESRAYWRDLFDLNVTAQWLVTARILPHMIRGGEVRIAFVTAEAGWAFTPGFGHYNASKAALNSLGACFAEECAARYPESDVQINVLNPGEARTEMNPSSARSPYGVVNMTLLLLSHPPGGPNGRFFHADGRHLAFGYAAPYPCSLITGEPINGVSSASAEPSKAPPRLLGERDGYNIVQHDGWYYGIPQVLGELHLECDDVVRYAGVIREGSRAAVESRIRSLARTTGC